MKHQLKAEKTIALPLATFHRAGLSGDISLEVLEGALLATRNEMTALELVGTIESLEAKLKEYYQILQEWFARPSHCGVCEFCEDFLDPDEEYPSWPQFLTGADQDITDLSDEKVEYLHDIGLCLWDLNESIEEDELIY